MNMADASVTALHIRVQRLVRLYAWPGLSVAELLCDCRDPTSVAYDIVGQDLSAQHLTYGDLRAESERFASALAGLGVRAGDRVATLMESSREYLVTLMGIWRLGAVHVPLITAFAPPAVAFRLIDSKARVVVCDPSQRLKLQPGECIPADPNWQVITTGPPDQGDFGFHALLASASRAVAPVVTGSDAPIIHIYTPGTSERPKAVVVPAKALAAFHAYAEFALDLQLDDVYCCAAEPGCAYGLYCGVLGAFTTGVRSVLLQGGISAERTFAVLCNQGVSNFAATPAVYRSLRASGVAIPGKLTLLRRASSAGGPLASDVNAWAKSVLGVEIHDHYGQTETGMLINDHHAPFLKKPTKTGSMGQAMPGWTAVVLRGRADEPAALNEVGRVAMDLSKSPLAWFTGYLDDPKKSAEKFCGNGRWYLTGDLGRIDEDGYLHFSSRDHDVMTTAGYRFGTFKLPESVCLPVVA
jgi:acetyl-CoA synthetase